MKKKIEKKRPEIESGEVLLLVEDECHLVWGDVLGYVWGAKAERVAVHIENEKERQTYYGTLNLVDGSTFSKRQSKGNAQETIKFLEALIDYYVGQKIILLWDKASYHDCAAVKSFFGGG